MPLDNALRTALLREGEAIPADAAGALPLIAERVRSHRRRRMAEVVAVAVAIGAVVWAPGAHLTERAPDTRPAERPRPPAERREERAPESTRGASVDMPPIGRAGRPVRAGSASRATAGTPATPARRAGRSDTPSRPTHVADPLFPRRLTERYDVSYVAGTHVGENAGTGCSKYDSAMGSNDCIPLQVGPDETRISLRLTDDTGVPVGATVYQHSRGDSSEFSFCGDTGGYVDVEPDALLLVYIDTSVRCSEDGPRAGTLVALLR